MCTPMLAIGAALTAASAAMQKRAADNAADERNAYTSAGLQSQADAQQRITSTVEESLPQYSVPEQTQRLDATEETLRGSIHEALQRGADAMPSSNVGGKLSGDYDRLRAERMVDAADAATRQARNSAATMAPGLLGDEQARSRARTGESVYRDAYGAGSDMTLAQLGASQVREDPGLLSAVAGGVGSSMLTSGLGQAFAGAPAPAAQPAFGLPAPPAQIPIPQIPTTPRLSAPKLRPVLS